VEAEVDSSIAKHGFGGDHHWGNRPQAGPLAPGLPHRRFDS